jgi:nucleoside-diphosphate-sugar epimerase
VVHLAAIPGPTHVANAATFTNDIACTYNVFAAARQAGIRDVVWASCWRSDGHRVVMITSRYSAVSTPDHPPRSVRNGEGVGEPRFRTPSLGHLTRS